MLREVTDTVLPLNFVLQKDDGLLCLPDPIYLNKALLV